MVTILSVVLVALVVPFAARVPDYAQQFKEMEQDRDTRLALAQEAATEIRNEIAAKGGELESALATISSLTAELDRSNNDNKALQTRLNQAEVTVSRSAAGMEIAARGNEVKSQTIGKQSELIQDHLGQIAALSSQNGDLTQTLIEARSNIRRLSDGFLRVQEQNQALTQQLLESQASLKAANEELAVFVDLDENPLEHRSPIAIRGSVTKINQITDGITFVQLNVGKRDLVEPGMTFTVSRGDAFIAKVKISSVDTAEAVGELTLGGGVQKGDTVQTGGR